MYQQGFLDLRTKIYIHYLTEVNKDKVKIKMQYFLKGLQKRVLELRALLAILFTGYN